MAKKKDKVGEEVVIGPQTKQELMDSVKDEIDKTFGKGLMKSGQALIDKPVQIIPWSPAFDVALGGGVPEGSWITVAGQEKKGKEQALDAIVYTPSGPKTMGEIKVGDLVCNASGGTSKVVGVYPQGIKKLYNINFVYGDSVESSETHLWEVIRIGTDKPRVMELKDFKNNLRLGNKCIWSIKMPKPVYFEQYGKQTINPYLLGLLIGDGGITQSIIFTSSDKFLVERVAELLPENHCIKHKSKYDYSITKSDITKNGANILKNQLAELGLYGKKSLDKFIPREYLYCPLQSRLEIIRGLLDTDGSVGNKGNPEFYTSSKQLALDFQFLIESIGGAANINKKITKCNGKWFKSWKVVVRYDGEYDLFKLPRKLEKIKKRVKGKVIRNIESVEYSREAECQCIELEGEEKLYLTNHCVPTHNTTSVLSFCANAQKEEYGSRPIMYLSVEHRLKKRDLLGIKGLKTEPPDFYFIQSEPGKILSSTDFLNIGSIFLKSVPGGVLIIDSISSLLNPKVLSDGIGSSDFGRNNQTIGQFCDLNASTVATNRNVVISILQFYTNTSGYGKKNIAKVATKVKYQADIQLEIKNSTPWTIGGKEDGDLIGQYQDWLMPTSAIGKPGSFTSYLRYGVGLDNAKEIFMLAMDLGLIEKGGAWYTFNFLESQDLIGTDYEGKESVSIQGEDSSCAVINENKAWADKLTKQVKELLGVK